MPTNGNVDERATSGSQATFHVRDWLARRVACDPSDLVADGSQDLPGFAGSQATYTRDGEWAGDIRVSNVHGRSRISRDAPYRVLTAQWRGGSATTRINADDTLAW